MEDCITEILEESWAEMNCSDGDDSYIEIELSADKISHIKDNNCTDNDGGEGEEEEYKLRISISSSTISIPLISDIQNESINNNVGITEEPNLAAVTPLQNNPSVRQTEVEEFLQQNMVFNSVSVINPTDSREFRQTDHAPTTMRATRVIPYDNIDLLCARKQPSMTTTTTTTNGVMMNLIIKFRGINIRALFASLVKPKAKQPCQGNNGHNNNKSRKKYKTFFQCYQKRLVNPSKKEQGIRRNKQWDMEDDSISICGSFKSSKKSSNKVMEMELGTIRGIFSAMGMSISEKRSRSKRIKTQSNYSCESTPIHEGFSLCCSNNTISENSIQAAIAYCKSSFGQTSDFSFRSSISSSSPSGSVTCSD